MCVCLDNFERSCEAGVCNSQNDPQRYFENFSILSTLLRGQWEFIFHVESPSKWGLSTYSVEDKSKDKVNKTHGGKAAHTVTKGQNHSESSSWNCNSSDPRCDQVTAHQTSTRDQHLSSSVLTVYGSRSTCCDVYNSSPLLFSSWRILKSDVVFCNLALHVAFAKCSKATARSGETSAIRVWYTQNLLLKGSCPCDFQCAWQNDRQFRPHFLFCHHSCKFSLLTHRLWCRKQHHSRVDCLQLTMRCTNQRSHPLHIHN